MPDDDEVAMTTLLLKVMAELRLDYVKCVPVLQKGPSKVCNHGEGPY